MSKQVALLRGINVGGRNKVGMAPLRELLEGFGYDEVRTHLQSGNVVFSTAEKPERAAKRIAEGVSEQFGVQVPVLTRSRADLQKIVKAHPLSGIASDPARLLVTFLSAAPKAKLVKEVDPASYTPDVFRFEGGREIYVWCPNGVHKTKLGHAFWEKRLGVTATARNWRTVERLLEMAGE
ncbi:DUF1697 domain-containing protein [Streptosporangium sp. 'caverna']|uniref:DUF1697 domain-containing protein n=1 Tax=Streptosporangium sp. 'caverna' TaxID=2202249 RepID=UPI000D7DDCB7|nr:DUF1697 domain-containing protein [Streptosporangium sp. 'caverna']AWS42979.1 hypothetical protein DKM19_18015 [Streptosporangium sp. 'caverna']